MKCPHCNRNISNKQISHHLASIGGKKSKRIITPEAQRKMQDAVREKRNKTIPRQVRWQRRQILKRKCSICGKPAPNGSRCNACGIKRKLYMRETHGWQAKEKGKQGRFPKYI